MYCKESYIAFAICAVMAGLGALLRGKTGDFFVIIFGLAALVLPFLIILNKKLK